MRRDLDQGTPLNNDSSPWPAGQGQDRQNKCKEKHGATAGIFSELQSEAFGYLLVPAHLKQNKKPLKPCSRLLFGAALTDSSCTLTSGRAVGSHLSLHPAVPLLCELAFCANVRLEAQRAIPALSDP